MPWTVFRVGLGFYSEKEKIRMKNAVETLAKSPSRATAISSAAPLTRGVGSKTGNMPTREPSYPIAVASLRRRRRRARRFGRPSEASSPLFFPRARRDRLTLVHRRTHRARRREPRGHAPRASSHPWERDADPKPLDYPPQLHKNRKKRGHVSAGHGRIGKHRKHPSGRGNAGVAPPQIMMDKYHLVTSERCVRQRRESPIEASRVRVATRAVAVSARPRFLGFRMPEPRERRVGGISRAPALAPDATARVARYVTHHRGGDIDVVILPNPSRPHRPMLQRDET